MSVRALANVWPAMYDGSARRWAFVSLALPACAGGLASVAELATSGWFMICATRADSVLSGLRRHSPKQVEIVLKMLLRFLLADHRLASGDASFDVRGDHLVGGCGRREQCQCHCADPHFEILPSG